MSHESPDSQERPLFQRLSNCIVILPPAILGLAFLAYGGWLIWEFAGISAEPRSQASIPQTLLCLPVAAHLVVWTLAPPAWFLLELWARTKTNITSRQLVRERFELLKYNQELAGKLWAAVLVALLYFFPDGPIYKIAHHLATGH
jgi:hypothetical protein